MEPQAPAAVFPQLTDQVTPAFEASFFTVAESWLVPSGVTEAGCTATVTEMVADEVTVTVATALTGVAPSVAVAVAVIVTGFAELAFEGAV
jgi:hypothetical protein